MAYSWLGDQDSNLKFVITSHAGFSGLNRQICYGKLLRDALRVGPQNGG